MGQKLEKGMDFRQQGRAVGVEIQQESWISGRPARLP